MDQAYSSVAQSPLQNSHEVQEMCVYIHIYIQNTKDYYSFQMINFIMKSSPQTHTQS